MGRFINCLNRHRSPIDWQRRARDVFTLAPCSPRALLLLWRLREKHVFGTKDGGGTIDH